MDDFTYTSTLLANLVTSLLYRSKSYQGFRHVRVNVIIYLMPRSRVDYFHANQTYYETKFSSENILSITRVLKLNIFLSISFIASVTFLITNMGYIFIIFIYAFHRVSVKGPSPMIKILWMHMHTQRTSRAWKFSFRGVCLAHRILDPAFVSVRLEIDRRIGGSSDCETRGNRKRTKPGLSPLSGTDNGLGRT